MNSYQAIEATDLKRLAELPEAHLPPAQALAYADDTWSEVLQWKQNPSHSDSTVLIDAFGNGASFLSVLRLWHETHFHSALETSTNPRPELTVYALDAHPWALECLQAYWREAPHSMTDGGLDHLLTSWPALAPGLHCIQFKPWRCHLWLWFGDAEKGLNQLSTGVDAAWPRRAWSHKAERLLNSKLNVLKQSLASQNHPSLPSPAKALSVAVVGAGIAGSCTARALCEQGFQVHLLDAAEGPAAGASGNWVGAFHPHITRDDTPLSQLTRLGCEFSLQALESLTQQGFLTKGQDWDTPGHLQTIPDDEVQRTRETLAQLRLPDSLVQWAEPFSRLNTPLHGLFFPQGAWVKPVRWVQANLQACGALLKMHYSCPVERVTDLGSLLGFQPDAVVIACAQHSLDLAGVDSSRANSVKGQITRLKKVSDMPYVASGESYAIAPSSEDWMLLGATYERPVGALVPTEASDALNIERFKAAFPDVKLGLHVESRCAVRFVWADRLPVVGRVFNLVEKSDSPNFKSPNPISANPTVYLNTAYASRGLTWAALAAQLVASNLRLQAGLCAETLETKLTCRMNPRVGKSSGI